MEGKRQLVLTKVQYFRRGCFDLLPQSDCAAIVLNYSHNSMILCCNFKHVSVRQLFKLPPPRYPLINVFKKKQNEITGVEIELFTGKLSPPGN